MKRFMASVAALAACFCMFAFGGCKSDGYSETFLGAVSRTTYESAEDAVKGFLSEEISGQAATAVYVGYQKIEELSEKEINSLAIGEEHREGLISVEKGEVEYTEKESEQTASLAASEAATHRRELYILTYTEMFRFFVPAASEGESLSASYFSSVFRAESYLNCTMNAEITAEGGSESYVQKAVAKVTQEALFEHDTITSQESGKEPEQEEFEKYAIYSGSRLYWAFKEDEEIGWGANSGEKITVGEHFIRWFKDMFGALDHSYFEKTSTGYALRSDKHNTYLQSMGYTKGDYELEYIIHIRDGRMSDLKMRIAYNGFEESMKLDFSDFGTTVIDVPAEVLAAISTVA